MYRSARLIAVAVVSCVTVVGFVSARESRSRGGTQNMERIDPDESEQLDPGRLHSPRPSRGRPSCFNPWPNFEPPTPGTCFLPTNLGAYFNLSDGSDFLFVETFGDNDDVLRYGPEPDRELFSHQTSNGALFAYCPPDVTGTDCLIFIFPGPGAWIGWGRISLNTALDRGLNFTCPSIATTRGLVQHPETGEIYRIESKLVRVKNPDGTCREVQNDISVRPRR